MDDSTQFKNQIRDYHDLDLVFQFAEKAKTNNDQNVKKNLELLVKTVYQDILFTRRESDRRNIDKIEVAFSDQTNELLDKIGGISTIFDKTKTIVEEQIKNGKIEQSDKEKILKNVQKELQKRLDKYRKSGSDRNKSHKKTILSPDSKKLNEFTRNILGNEKLVKKMSDSLKSTIKGQTKKQSISIINLLTGNKYKELSLKIRKDNISRLSTLNGKTTKLSVFQKIKEFKKSGKLGKMFNYRTILKHFKVNRQKLNKKGFLGLYNEYVYKELIRRVDEFSNVLNFKGRMGKAILKGVLKWGGGMIVSGIAKTLGFGWRMMKSAFKQIVNITKAVGKMGVSIFRRIRNFIFTKTGMWIVGFFSGVIYAAVIEPLIKKFKSWFELILNPMKEWLGFDSKEEITIEQLKNKLALKLKDNIEQDIKQQRNKKIAESIVEISKMLNEVEDQMRDIDILMNGGGWKKSVAGAVAGSAGTIGSLVGMAIGSLICPGLGSFVGAAIGGAIGGFVSSSVNYFAKRIRKNVDEETTLSEYSRGIREKWNGLYREKAQNNNDEQYNSLIMQRRIEKDKIDETQNRIDELDRILEQDPNNKQAFEERENLLKENKDAHSRYDKLSQDIVEKNSRNNDVYNDIVDNISKKLQEEDGYIFDLSGFHSMQNFFNDAKIGKFKKVKPKDGRWSQKTKDFTEDDIGKVKTYAFKNAIIKYNNGEIDFENIPKYADSYMMSIVKRGKQKDDVDVRQDKNPKKGSVRSINYTLNLDDEFYDFKEGVDLKQEFNVLLREIQAENKIPDMSFHKVALMRVFEKMYFSDIENYNRDEMKKMLTAKWADLELDRQKQQKNTKGSELPSLEQKDDLMEKSLLEMLQKLSESRIKMIRILDKNVMTEEEEKELIKKSSIVTKGQNDNSVKVELKEIDILKKKKDEKTKQEITLRDNVQKTKKIVEGIRKDQSYSKKMTQAVERTILPEIGYVFVPVEKQDDGTSANDEGGISYLYSKNAHKKP